MKALYNLGDNIYWLTFEKQYDLCMTFWRVSERKESTNPDMRAGKLTLVDYMEWYAQQYGKGQFSYGGDWCGYNQLSDDLKLLYPNSLAAGQIKEATKYDLWMADLYTFLNTASKGKKFYLIGTVDGDYHTLQHEFAHALYGVNEEYHKIQTSNIEALDDEHNVVLCSNLTEMGYSEACHHDELQAYLSTGWQLKKIPDVFYRPLSPKVMRGISEPFVQTFTKFSEGKVPKK